MQFVLREQGEAACESRARIRAACRSDETRAVVSLLDEVAPSPSDARRVERLARELVAHVRATRREASAIDSFLHEYDLSTQEGVALMCLAESLLRVPDAATADRLIRDKIGRADWERHLGDSDSVFVNASTWGLMLTGRIVRLDAEWDDDATGLLGRLINRVGEPLIREATVHAMRIVGRQFVMGRTIDEALERARDEEAKGYRHSFDMLGEAARTAADADRYLGAYLHAIDQVGASATASGVFSGPGVSVKLSALHPRYEVMQRERVLSELLPRFIAVAERARARGIALTMDAEEADRLELSLDVFEAAARASSLTGWDGLGLAVQAYQKRAVHVIAWLDELARTTKRRIPVRLVKGAYWTPRSSSPRSRDSKAIRCSRARRRRTFPTLPVPGNCWHGLRPSIHSLQPTMPRLLQRFWCSSGSERHDFEFQRLHGMGQSLYRKVVEGSDRGIGCRIYAPVGSHEELLAYLVRRLLENGANTSFVNRIVDDAMPIDSLVEDPADVVEAADPKPHPGIVLPRDLFGPDRRNSQGLDLNDPDTLRRLASDMQTAASGLPWRAGPDIVGKPAGRTESDRHQPGRPQAGGRRSRQGEREPCRGRA